MAESGSLSMDNKCPICMETRQELKTLNCDHSFCLPCLQDWIKVKDSLECPNCRKNHPIPEGGLRELPSNLKKTAELDKVVPDSLKCSCGNLNAEFYCQDCSQYLCSACKKCHELFPALKTHTIRPIDANWLPAFTEPLHPQMCPDHEKKFEFYCNVCKIPICEKCAMMEHSKEEGDHEPIRASDAFDDFKLTANVLIAQVNVYKHQIQGGLNKCTANVLKLSKNKTCIKRDIKNTVEDIVNSVRKAGEELEKKLDDVCQIKMERSDTQMEELKSTLANVEEKQNTITNLLGSDAATALQTCHQAIADVQGAITVLPDTEPADDGKVYFTADKDKVLGALEKHSIGSVGEKPNANIFEIVSYPEVVSQKQPFCVEIAQKTKCEIDNNDLKAMSGDHGQSIQEIQKGKYIVYVDRPMQYYLCTSIDLDVTFCNASIKGSPINIGVKYNANIQIINVSLSCKSILVCQTGFLLIFCSDSNVIFKLNSSGAFISKITLSPSSRIGGICEMKNTNLIVCDSVKRSLNLYKQDGHVIKTTSLGQGYPNGVDVNEALGLVYVADQLAHCIHVYMIGYNCKVNTIGSRGSLEGQLYCPYDVAVTREGNVIIADNYNNRLQLFDSDGKFTKVLIYGGDQNGTVKRPSRVVVDEDGNIIVASHRKVQVFDSNGQFIEVIKRSGPNAKNYSFALSIVSHFPRRLALAEEGSTKIELMYY